MFVDESEKSFSFFTAQFIRQWSSLGFYCERIDSNHQWSSLSFYCERIDSNRQWSSLSFYCERADPNVQLPVFRRSHYAATWASFTFNGLLTWIQQQQVSSEVIDQQMFDQVDRKSVRSSHLHLLVGGA